MKIRLFTIPNLFTCLNLISGCLAIVMAFMANYPTAFGFILLAALFDFLDGFLARLLKQYSEVGVQLDSLADVVSFGVAPSMMLFNLSLYNMNGFWMSALIFLIAAFSALRLAKFNIDPRQTAGFYGLPTPACAILISSLAFLAANNPGTDFSFYILRPGTLIVLVALVCFLLISEIRMFSLKFSGPGFKGNEVRYIFLFVCVLALALLQAFAFPAIIVLYILGSLALHFLCNKPGREAR